VKSNISERSKTVAVVVPVYREHLTADEKISYRHLNNFLGDYDKYLVAPETLKIAYSEFRIKRFSKDFFRNTVSYSALLLSRDFYQAFADYEFVLIYQLDALVFSDQLAEWCESAWDYIGAPWLNCEDADFVDVPTVGNGGFSLRRVPSFLKVIDSPGYDLELVRYQKALHAAEPLYLQDGPVKLSLPRRLIQRFGLSNQTQADILEQTLKNKAEAFGINEDYFWSFKAKKYYSDFKIAPVSEALRFSFEVQPRRCYELNNFQLPFGCHAWNRYDRKFWEPFLLK